MLGVTWLTEGNGGVWTGISDSLVSADVDHFRFVSFPTTEEIEAVFASVTNESCGC